VLEALAKPAARFRFEFENFDWGGDYYREHGVMMPADGLDALRNKDAILFGSAGDPHIPDHITLWGLRLKICQGFDQYANVRPTRILPGIDGPLKRCGPTTWTGSSCARTPKASTPASAAACTRATRSRPPPTCR
jgi:tartrate dehydrogenase/decarboxylase/D-malate dehydrogenase